MDQDNESFRNKIDQLMELFRRFAEKMEKENLTDSSPYSQNFKMMLENYDRMRNFLPDDIPENLRAPFEQMLNDLIEKLRDEIGDTPLSTQQTETSQQTISEIEQKLKQGNLSSSEMDELLDKMIAMKKGSR
jgi:molecular chaperone DnaK (HSP70)